MAAQLDEEQQEAGADDAHAQPDENGCHGAFRIAEQGEQSRYQQNLSADDLAFQLCVTEHETLGEQSQQETDHHQSVKHGRQGQRQQHTHDDADQQQIEKQHMSLKHQEPVERCQTDVLFGSAEREIDASYQYERSGRTDGGSPPYGSIAKSRQDEDSGQRAQRECEAGKPRCVVIGFGAHVRLAGVDDERRREHHLRQSERGSQQQPLHQYHPELGKLGALVVEIDQRHHVGDHCDDGPHAHLVAAVALYEPRALRAQQVEPQPERSHAQSSLHGREVLGLDEPSGHGGYEDVDRHGEQQVSDDEAPKVGMPQSDVYGGVLGIQA